MLPNFTKALERHKDELGYNQFWRYTKAGRLPKILTWLAQRPELAAALAEDAAQLAGDGGQGAPNATTGKGVITQ